MGSDLLVRDCRIAAKAFARANGHRMSRWDVYGMCECVQCGSVMADSDAVMFVMHADVSALGELSGRCIVILSSSPTTAA